MQMHRLSISSPSRPFFNPLLPSRAPCSFLFTQRTNLSSLGSSLFEPFHLSAHASPSSLHLFLPRFSRPSASRFSVFSSHTPPPNRSASSLLARLIGGCVLALLLILSARRVTASRRFHLPHLPAIIARNFTLEASGFFSKFASDLTNFNGEEIILHRAATHDDSAIDAKNSGSKNGMLVVGENTCSQEQSVVPAALFVYGRGTTEEHRTSYSMMYAGQGPLHNCQKLTGVTMVGKTYNKDDVIEVKKEENAEDQMLFQDWLCKLQEEAIQRGLSRDVVEKALSDVKISKDILELDSNQPEVKLSADAYLARMVSDLRISYGVKAFKENFPLLNELAAKYGVPAPILVAIWGIESNYGTFTGKWDTVQALVTLAYESEEQRARYFREELIHALGIIEQGHGPRGDFKLKGSWAGAMGQCQFMPSSFQTYAVDYDQDGCKDIWESRADTLASMANYLQLHGWKKGCLVAQKVTMPETLDPSLLGLSVKKTIAEWNDNYGVQILRREESLQHETASLIAPDGPGGCAYLVFNNFATIMSYNPRVLYAVAVHELSNMITNQTDSKNISLSD